MKQAVLKSYEGLITHSDALERRPRPPAQMRLRAARDCRRCVIDVQQGTRGHIAAFRGQSGGSQRSAGLLSELKLPIGVVNEF
jgi:hypothetical protein